MNILCADFILTCKNDFEIIENGAICFNEKIIEVGKKDDILSKYKNVKIKKLPKNSVIMPGLINAHTHLEFSQNIATLTYGSFIPWLISVIKNRVELSEKYSDKNIDRLLLEMLKSGTTTIGNISSFGIELLACKNAKQKIIYFVEAIGSIPDAVDALFNDFKVRFFEAQQEQSKKFIPAISVHSLYSTHKIMAEKIVKLAKDENTLVSTHFMESLAERHWVDSGIGGFKTFFNDFNPHAKPMYKNGIDFLQIFKGVKTLFTHAIFANDEELKIISDTDSSITHCPTSNRLLGCGKLDLKSIKNNDILLSLGTDGLSSNTSLNLWDEMRNALYLHADEDLNNISKALILASTNGGGKALNLNSGVLQKDNYSDIIAFCLKDVPKDISTLPLQIILQTNKVSEVYINGEFQL